MTLKIYLVKSASTVSGKALAAFVKPQYKPEAEANAGGL